MVQMHLADIASTRPAMPRAQVGHSRHVRLAADQWSQVRTRRWDDFTHP